LDHREPWLRHALSTLGLGDAEDKSMADALAAVDALLEV
jgi:hypothetical protein